MGPPLAGRSSADTAACDTPSPPAGRAAPATAIHAGPFFAPCLDCEAGISRSPCLLTKPAPCFSTGWGQFWRGFLSATPAVRQRRIDRECCSDADHIHAALDNLLGHGLAANAARDHHRHSRHL